MVAGIEPVIREGNEVRRIKLLRYFHGVLLHSIAEQTGMDNTTYVRDELKAMLKKHLRIDSMGNLTDTELSVAINEIVALFASECGVEIARPNDPEGYDEMDLKTFLKFVYDKEDTRTVTRPA